MVRQKAAGCQRTAKSNLSAAEARIRPKSFFVANPLEVNCGAAPLLEFEPESTGARIFWLTSAVAPAETPRQSHTEAKCSTGSGTERQGIDRRDRHPDRARSAYSEFQALMDPFVPF